MNIRKLRLESLEERALLAVVAGGFEQTAELVAPTEATTWVVNTLEDPTEWDTTDDVLSLREAIDSAQMDDTITFDESLAGGTVTLYGNQLEITKGITIDASSIDGITIDADGKSRVFYINGGSAENPVTLVNLTMTGGGNIDSGNTANGAGIYATGVTVLANCTFTGNSATGNTGAGAAIANVNGTMTMTDCIITGNTATGTWFSYGGGIYTTGGTLTITGSLIADNTSGASGSSYYGYAGAIYNESTTLTVTNTTIAGNTASGTWGSYGGAVWTNSEATFYNSIVAENTAATSTDIYVVADKAEAYACNTLSSFEDWTESSDCIVYDSSEILFNDNYTLASGSQAIDAGNNDYVVSDIDLAGNTRIVNGTVDLGAYEYQGGKTEQLDTPVFTTGSNGVYVSYGANRHILAWDAVDNAASYELAYSADSSSANATWTTVETGDTYAVVTGLTYGDEVSYRVRALGEGSFADSEWSERKTFAVCPMDIDGDGDIGGADRGILAYSWLAEEGDDDYIPAADIDGNGDVGGSDRAYLANNWLNEVGIDDMTYPRPLAADIAFAEFASADIGVDLDVF